MFINNFFHKTVILRKLFVFLFFFTFIKILVVSFSGDRHMGYWSYALLFCDRKGKLACTILYIYSGVCEYMYFVKQISEEKKLNRLYNTFIVINFIDTNIYHFIIWNLIDLSYNSFCYNEIFCHAVSIWGWLSIKFTQENYEWPSEVPWKVCMEFKL